MATEVIRSGGSSLHFLATGWDWCISIIYLRYFVQMHGPGSSGTPWAQQARKCFHGCPVQVF